MELLNSVAFDFGVDSTTLIKEWVKRKNSALTKEIEFWKMHPGIFLILDINFVFSKNSFELLYSFFDYSKNVVVKNNLCFNELHYFNKHLNGLVSYYGDEISKEKGVLDITNLTNLSKDKLFIIYINNDMDVSVEAIDNEKKDYIYAYKSVYAHYKGDIPQWFRLELMESSKVKQIEECRDSIFKLDEKVAYTEKNNFTLDKDITEYFHNKAYSKANMILSVEIKDNDLISNYNCSSYYDDKINWI